MSPTKLRLVGLVALVFMAAGVIAMTYGLLRILDVPAPAPHANRAAAFTQAIDPDARCEESPMFARVQRAVDGKPLEQVDAALCLSQGMLYYCHAGYEPGDKPKCDPIADARDPDEKRAAAAKAQPTPAPAAGSGSAK